jgi:S-adenosylhomocysteine hydrolase
LAEWGRKEIKLAEAEMPGLMALREEFGQTKAFKRRSYCWLSAHDHSNRSFD